MLTPTSHYPPPHTADLQERPTTGASITTVSRPFPPTWGTIWGTVVTVMGEDGIWRWEGVRYRLTGTTRGQGWIIDTWQDLNPAEDAQPWQRAGAVVTVAPWAQEDVAPFTPEWWAWAVAHPPAGDPGARWVEAMRQGDRRQQERLTEPGQSVQQWPPPDAPTLFACLDPEDSRKGWARWTWLPDGSVVLQHGGGLLDGLDLPLPWGDRSKVHQWVQQQGWRSIPF